MKLTPDQITHMETMPPEPPTVLLTAEAYLNLERVRNAAQAVVDHWNVPRFAPDGTRFEANGPEKHDRLVVALEHELAAQEDTAHEAPPDDETDPADPEPDTCCNCCAVTEERLFGCHTAAGGPGGSLPANREGGAAR